ncbi:hypothetical protein GUITHDRAFT_58537, partial [Guillardia theta CCMP2712]
KQNQDSFLLSPFLGGDLGVSLFGIFDGHGRQGHLVSSFAKKVLPSIVGSKEEDGGNSGQGIPQLLSETCSELQRLLLEQTDFDVMASGSTAVIALIVDDLLFVANVGDSRAILAHARERLAIVAMSTDQTPGVKEEKERIESHGGVVYRDEDAYTGEQGPFRVWRRDLAGPGLAMSRSIGDAIAHDVGVTALPTVKQYELKDSDRFLLLATDGVWDMLENSEVVDIAARASEDGRGDPLSAAAQVCETAKKAWEFKETRMDDISCLLVFL